VLRLVEGVSVLEVEEVPHQIAPDDPLQIDSSVGKQLPSVHKQAFGPVQLLQDGKSVVVPVVVPGDVVVGGLVDVELVVADVVMVVLVVVLAVVVEPSLGSTLRSAQFWNCSPQPQ